MPGGISLCGKDSAWMRKNKCNSVEENMREKIKMKEKTK